MKKEETKKKINIKLLIAIGLVIVAAIILCVIIFSGKENEYKDKATYSESFFIKNNKGRYALYNKKGKQLSKFIYETSSYFINGSSLVTNKNNDYAVINENGKEEVKFGTYEYMSNYSGLYKARKDGVYYLLDSNGKVLLKGKDLSIESYGRDYPFIIANLDGKVTVFNFDGKEIFKYSEKEDAKSPTANYIDEFATIFYNNKTYLFNVKTRKLITTINKKEHYCVNNHTEDKKVFTLNTCASFFNTVENPGNIIVNNGKVIDLSKKCKGFNIYEDNILCSTDDGAYFVKLKGKKAELKNKINSGAQFIDGENYAVRSSDYKNINIYKNGKKAAKVSGVMLSNGWVNEYYLISSGKGYYYYNKDGKIAINTPYKSISKFDKNDLAVVSEDGRTYYLINKKGKKISKEYKQIQLVLEDNIYYMVTNDEGLKGLIDNKGKQVIDNKYNYISIKDVYGKYYAVVKKDSTNMLINLDSKKTIISTKNPLTIENNFVKETGKTSKYYTFSGDVFYKEK